MKEFKVIKINSCSLKDASSFDEGDDGNIFAAVYINGSILNAHDTTAGMLEHYSTAKTNVCLYLVVIGKDIIYINASLEKINEFLLKNKFAEIRVSNTHIDGYLLSVEYINSSYVSIDDNGDVVVGSVSKTKVVTLI